MQILIVASKGSGGSFKAASRMADAYRAVEGTNVEFRALEDELPQGFVNRIIYRISNVLTAKLSSYFESPVSLDCLLHYLDLPNFGDFDIIHLHWINRRGVSLKKLDFGGAKVFWTLHDSWPLNGFFHLPEITPTNPMKKRLGRALAWMAKRNLETFVRRNQITFISPSKYMRAKCHSSWPAFEVIHLPNFMGKIYCQGTSEKNSETKSLLFIADSPKADSYKGFSFIIQLVQRLDESLQGFYVTIVGRALDSDIAKSWKGIRFVGRVDSDLEMMRIYSESYATFILSKIENAPYVALESICALTPVISYNVGGVAEIISPNAGILVPYGDIDGVLTALRQLSNDVSLESISQKRCEILAEQKELVNCYLETYRSAGLREIL